MAGHGVLGACLCNFDQINETALAFLKTSNDRLLRKLGEIVVLDDEVVQVVSQVVGACSSPMPIEHAKETDLGPLYIQVLFALRFENVEDDGDAVLIVIAYNALVGVGGVGFNHTALLLRGFRGLVILQEERLGVEHGWILAKEQGLHLHELNVAVLRARA